MEIYIQTTPRQKCGVGAFPVIKAPDNFPDIVQRWEAESSGRAKRRNCAVCANRPSTIGCVNTELHFATKNKNHCNKVHFCTFTPKDFL